MANEDQLTTHRHTFDVTIAPVCAVCGLPLIEVLQIAQEEHATLQQQFAQALALLVRVQDAGLAKSARLALDIDQFLAQHQE